MRRLSLNDSCHSMPPVAQWAAKRWFGKLRQSAAGQSKPKRLRLHRRRLGMEVLEARRVLATYIVDTTADTATGICGIDGVGNIGCSLRSAIIAANNNPNEDVIMVPAGTYTLTIANNFVFDQTEGSLDVLDSVSIIGMTGAAADVVIDGNSLDRVFNVAGNDVFTVDARFESLTIQNGLTNEEGGGIDASFANLEVVNSVLQNNVVSDPSFAFAGGAIFADDASLFLDSSVIRNNSVSGGKGGGVAFFARAGYIVNPAANPTGGAIVVVDSRLEDNSADKGGGLFIEGADPNGTSAVLERVVFNQNSATTNGGGAHVAGVRNLIVTDGEFTFNNAGGSGGGLNVLPEIAVTEDAFVNVTGTSFRDNRGGLNANSFADGGAIFADISVQLSVRGAEFLRNTLGPSFGSGGAIRANDVLLIEDSDIRQNQVAAGSGGGVAYRGSSLDTLTITRTTFATNSASETGGALDVIGDTLGSPAPVTINDVTFDQNFAGLSGGGAYIYLAGSVDILNSRFLGNTSSEAGGGLYLLDTGAALIDQSLFDGNIASSGGGGAAILTDAAIEDSTFQNNVVTTVAFAFDEGGGGISIAQDFGFQPTVTVLRSTISNNRAPLGGGIGSANANLTITDSTIVGNQATNSFGGGGGIGFAQDDTMGVEPRVTLTVVSSLIQNNLSAADAAGIGIADADASIIRTNVLSNIASGRGGGIGIIGSSNSPTLSIEQSTVAFNGATSDGGGIAAVDAGLRALNITVSNNTSDGFGGGLAYNNNNATLASLIAFSTIASNRTLSGLGSNIASGALPIGVASSIFADPIGVNAAGTNILAGPGSINSQSFNIDSDGSGNFSSLGDQNNVDPRIGPLANNGGPVRTRALLTGSPAIDASDTSPLATDARGFPRLQDGNANGEGRNDIGSFELTALALVAKDDFAAVNRGASILIPVLDNDTTSTPPIRIVSTSGPTNGSVTIVGNQIRYTANNTFTGDDLFTYTITNSPVGIDTPSQTALVTVTVTDGNQAPTAISLSNSSVPSNSAIGTTVGDFSTTDPDLADIFTYTLVAGIGDNDNADFTILGDSLQVNQVFDFEVQDSYSIRVRSTDSGGLFTEQTFVITVAPVLRFIADLPVFASTDIAETIDGTTLTSNDIAGAQSPVGIVTIASITPTTAAGGSVTLLGQEITYTSPSGFVGIDTIEYVITDGFSSTTATLGVDVRDIFVPEVDLATSTLSNQPVVGVGDLISYTISVNNLSSTSASNVAVVTSVGSLATIDSFFASVGTVSIDTVSNIAVWNLTSIPPLTSFSYTLDVVADAPGLLSTDSDVSSDQIDSNLANNVSSIDVTITSTLPVELHTLSTGSGDGDIQLDVDAFGRFGTSAFGGSGPVPLADFDPVGAFGSMDVVSKSTLGFRIEADSEFTNLSQSTPGVSLVQQIDGSSLSATSAFVVGTLSVSLDQSVAPTFHPDNSRAGAQLRQAYTIQNMSTGAVSFDLARFLDADLKFEGPESSDGGGVLFDSNGRILTFITDSSGPASSNTPFVAMSATGGDTVADHRFDIDRSNLLEDRVFNPSFASPLRDTISGDINADGFADSGQGYDAAAALRNVFTLLPGQSLVYVTDTIFGITPTSLTPPVSGDLTGHVFCDVNSNGIEDLTEAAANAFVFVDLNGNRIFDSFLSEPSTLTDSQGNYSLFVNNLPSGELANVVVVNPSGCFPSVPEIGVTRNSLTTGMLSRDIATIFNPQTGLDEFVVINELGNDLRKFVQGVAEPFVLSSSTTLGKRPFAVSVYQPDGQSPVIAVAAIGSGTEPGALYVIDDAGVREFSAGDGPVSVVVDDFNGDSEPDFITASFRDGKNLSTPKRCW
jgi:CSLREA domain-containing protein